MKKYVITVALAIIIGGSGIKALGAEAASFKGDAGITPDSIFYAIDKAYDSVRVFFAKGDEKKAVVLAKIANERLGESEAMTGENKKELAAKAMDAYKEKMDEAQDRLEAAIEKNKDNNDAKKLNKLNEAEKDIAERQLKSIEVLKGLLDKVGENAKETIAKVIAMQEAKKEAVANMVEKRHELNDARKLYNELKVQLEKARRTGSADAIKKLEDQLKAQEAILEKCKDELAKAIEAKQAVIKEYKVGDPQKDSDKKNDNNGNQKGNENKKDSKPGQVKQDEKNTTADVKNSGNPGNQGKGKK